MLQILRNKSQSIVIQAIVVVIALVFIFWGVGANLMNNREAALVVNDEEISFEDFQLAYDRAITNLGNQFGGNVPPGLLESLGIKDQVINQLIQQTLLRQGALEMGVMVSSEEIQENIQNMVQFEENGVFSLEKYRQILSLNNYSPTKFEESIKLDILAQKASLNIGNFAATATDFEIEELHRMEKTTVAVQYVAISPDDYLETIAPSDEDLSEWYTTVQGNYKTTPQVKLQYLDFSYTTVGKKITIDPTSIEKYYQDNIAEYTRPEQRGARHILFRADENSSAEVHERQQEKAKETLELAKNGSDFSDLAKEYSEGPTGERGGDLGLFSRGQMVKPFDEAVFSLNSGELSEVVKTSFGYHIIKLEKIIPATTKPLEEATASIVEKLQKEQAKPLAFQVANESYESIIGAGSLKAYLEANPDKDILTTDFFSRNKPPASLGNDQKFLNAAFSLKEGELSSLIETGNGYVILFAEAIKQPAVPALEDVRDKVLQDYKNAKAVELAKETASTLLMKAKDGSTLAEATQTAGFTTEYSGYLSRSGTEEESSFPAALVDEIFKLSKKEPFPAEPIQQESAFFVFEFKGQKVPEIAATEEEKERYARAIVQLKQQQILSSWLKGRRQQAEILTHKSLTASN